MVLGKQGPVLTSGYRAAVLGHPVDHSLSPVLHETAYRELGLADWSYERHDCEEDGLAPFLTGLDASWRGLSLTMPLKGVALTLAQEVSPTAIRARAANTLIRCGDGGWDADNTDVYGIVAALAPHLPATVERALILGGGATARSAMLALADLGVGQVHAAARRPDAAAAELGPLADDLGVSLTVGPLAQWRAQTAEVAVSTLPPAGGAAAADALGDGDGPAVLLDVVYANWPTPLAQSLMGRHRTVVDGLDMLVQQAARQVELMTGEAPSAMVIEAMSSAARTASGRS